ncbi:biofilm protein TabA [Paenibacillus sp. UNC496MF]|uniref:YhcH/YjgK/YiaL family protein n=1 Tax=Paenibacillus sp. UNC496MF TaxID=1502753 RepID=UPI0008F1B64C|nr:YhcH/YjgK/YiaL family protein [Paenibacillus sp. UNC496MF]SFJ24114.1 biofilm protein TabA [Paenibacillus sp. UNC496MF]
MIISDMTNWAREKQTFPAGVRRAIERLQAMDLDALPAGRHDIGEEGMFLLINEPVTRTWREVPPETHRTHTDVQLLLSGREQMRVAKAAEDQIVTDDRYDAEDIAFYGEVHREQTVHLVPGDFVVLFPTDIHRPNCSADEDMPIRKAVVKIRADVLA